MVDAPGTQGFAEKGPSVGRQAVAGGSDSTRTGEAEAHPVQLLYDEHEYLAGRLRDLDALRERARQEGATADMRAELDAISDALSDEIGVHSNKEEIGLFPLLRRHWTAEGLIDDLLGEHAGIREAAHDFVASVGGWLNERRRGDAIPWIEPAQRVAERLSKHMYKENHEVFPRALKELTEDEVDDLRAVFERLED